MQPHTEARASPQGFLLQAVNQRGQHPIGRNIPHPYFPSLQKHIFIAPCRDLLVQDEPPAAKSITAAFLPKQAVAPQIATPPQEPQMIFLIRYPWLDIKNSMNVIRHNHIRPQHQLLILHREAFQHSPDALPQHIQHALLPHNRTQKALIVSHLNRNEKSPMTIIDISIPQRVLKVTRPHTNTIIPPLGSFKL